ncbi:jumonji domain containing 8 [Chamberlinius hualienensis]
MNYLKLILIINVYVNGIYSWIFENSFESERDNECVNEDHDHSFKNSGLICNIDVWDGSEKDFLIKYAYKAPVVLKTDNKQFRDRHSIEKLLERFGDSIVRLSSSNSYSYQKIDMSFRVYIDEMLDQSSVKKLANETFYFFGDVLPDEMKVILTDYNPIPFQLPDLRPALSFGIAGAGSGVPFHFHGPGFSETISGSKHWFMYPPHLTPSFNPNETTAQWFLNRHLMEDPNLFQCTIHQGQRFGAGHF